MKKNNLPKKLSVIKKTIAHLNSEQMSQARTGGPYTRVTCIDTNSAAISLDDCIITYEFCI